MSFYIQIESPAGAILGDGPITSAPQWRYTARMDRAGDFSFTLPATEPKATFVQKKNIARAFALVGSVWTEVGAGIIDKIERTPDDTGIATLSVSGPDLLGELAYRSVLNLKLYSGGLPVTHAAALTAVSAFAPAGWIFTADSTPPNDSVYGYFNGETVLAALIKIGDKCQDHFYRGTSRNATFASSFTASGVRAIRADGDLVAETCAITAITEQIDTHDLITRIYPRGSGNGDVQLTLKATTRTAPAGYTLDTTNNYIQATTPVATYGRIERQVDFREIGPISNTDADLQSAANMLFDAALEELKRRSSELEQATYTLELAQCSQLLRPMQSILVDYRDPDAGLTVNATLNILEATWQVDAGEVQTTGLVVSNADRWPASDVGAVVNQMEQGQLYQALPQLNANSYVTAYNKLVDQTQTAGFRFRFGAEVVQLQQVLFEFQLLPLESSVKSVGGSTSGSGSIPTTGPNTDTTGTGGNNTTGAGGAAATNAGGTGETDTGGTASSGSGGSGASGASGGTTGASGATDTTANGSGNTNTGGTAATGAGGNDANAGGPTTSGSSASDETGLTGAGATGLAGSGNTGTTGSGTTGTTGAGNTASGGSGATGSTGGGDTGLGGGADTGGSGTLSSGASSGETSSGGGGATFGAEGGDSDGSGNHRHSINLVRQSFDPGWYTVYYDDSAHRFKCNDASGGTFTTSTAVVDAFGNHTHDTSSHTHTLGSHTHSTGSHTHTVGSHTHSSAGHTHDIGSHTHSLGSHTHDIGTHTHTIGTHTHSVGSHTHAIGSHTHSVASHTHTISTHTHTVADHTHFVSNHTHSMADHTHSVGSHTHTIANHTHTINDHTHPIATHTHAIATHTHSMSQHTHTLNNHVHDLSESITAIYGIFRESVGNTFAIADLEYRVNSNAWAGLDTATSVSGGWYRLDITSLVQNALTLRQAQEDNQLEVRRKTAGATGKTGQIDAQLSVRNVIQAVAYV